MFDEYRLRNHGANAAWPHESSESNDQMNEKDDQITHFGSVSKPQDVKTSGPFCNSPGTGSPESSQGRAQMKFSSNNQRRESRRYFIRGAGTATLSAGVLGMSTPAKGKNNSGKLTKGDAAILRFLAAAEILESDMWIQYNELGGVLN